MYNKRYINGQYVVIDTPIEIGKKTEDNKTDTSSLSEEEALVLKIEEKLKAAEEKANLIREQADIDAQNIINNAKLEAQKIIDNAQIQIETELVDQMNAQLQQFAEILNNILNEAEMYIQNYFMYSHEFIIEVIKTIVKKYLKDDLFIKPQWMDQTLNSLRNKISSFKNVTIRMNDEMFSKYSYIFTNKMDEGINLKTDNSLKMFEVIAETDLGVFDISPKSYIEEILNTLEDSINENT